MLAVLLLRDASGGDPHGVRDIRTGREQGGVPDLRVKSGDVLPARPLAGGGMSDGANVPGQRHDGGMPCRQVLRTGIGGGKTVA